MSYASNLEKALDVVKRNEDFIKKLKASGYSLPESYERIPAELESIKNNPNRAGISSETLKSIQYLYNKNVINSRKSFNPTMTIDNLGTVNLTDRPLRTNTKKGKEQLKKMSEKLNDMLYEYLDSIDRNKYPNSEATKKADNLIRNAQTYGLDIYDIDFTKLVESGVEANKVRQFFAEFESVISKSPLNISPFREEIYEKRGREAHIAYLKSKDIGFTDADISLLERYIDNSQFWHMIHKANYSSDGEKNPGGKHEIKEAVQRLKTFVDVTTDTDDLKKLQELLRNSTNYRTVDNFVRTKISQANRKKTP